jgi:hypothetical protein
MKTIAFYTIVLMSSIFIILLIHKSVFWYKMKSSGKLLLTLKHINESGKYPGFSSFLWSLPMLGIILPACIQDSGEFIISRVRIAGIVFAVLMSIYFYLDVKIAIRFMDKGIFTHLKYIPWDSIDYYVIEEKSYKRNISATYIKIFYNKNNKHKKVNFNIEGYTEGNEIERILVEKNIMKKAIENETKEQEKA